MFWLPFPQREQSKKKNKNKKGPNTEKCFIWIYGNNKKKKLQAKWKVEISQITYSMARGQVPATIQPANNNNNMVLPLSMTAKATKSKSTNSNSNKTNNNTAHSKNCKMWLSSRRKIFHAVKKSKTGKRNVKSRNLATHTLKRSQKSHVSALERVYVRQWCIWGKPVQNNCFTVISNIVGFWIFGSYFLFFIF